jgi:hypothetical protein
MKHLDTIKVLFAGGGGVTGLLITTDLAAKILLTALTAGYILRKWYLMEKKK